MAFGLYDEKSIYQKTLNVLIVPSIFCGKKDFQILLSNSERIFQRIEST
jgi:hypothetical protein